MFVGILSLELYFPGSGSLKAKRFLLRSIKDRLKRFNVSVADDGSDLWQKSILTIASVSNDRARLHRLFERVQEVVLSKGEVEIIDMKVEIL